MVKGAYIFVWPDADSRRHRAVVETSTLSWIIVGVKDFDDGVNIAKSLVKEGIQAIELCGGWGSVGCAKIFEAVGDKIPVGAVSFGIESVGKFTEWLRKSK
ncbi:DUF6506 family protein [Chloroflexota bacterium]